MSDSSAVPANALDRDDPERRARKDAAAALFRALEAGDEAAVLGLWPSCDPDARNLDGETPLIAAARLGRAGSVEALLPRSDPTMTTDVFHPDVIGDSEWLPGETALLAAARRGNADCVRLLAPVSPLDEGGRFYGLGAIDLNYGPLLAAAEIDNVESIEAMAALARLAVDTPDGRRDPDCYWHAIDTAAEHGHTDSLRELIDIGRRRLGDAFPAHFSQWMRRDVEPASPHGDRLPPNTLRYPSALMVAAERGHADCVRLLLPYGAVAERASDYLQRHDMSALGRAARNGHPEVVSVLLEAAEPALRPANQGEALIEAAGGGDVESLRRILHARVEGVWRGSEYVGRALFDAIARGQDEIVETLIELADPTFRDGQGRTPLMAAAAQSQLECIRRLLPRSNTDARDAEGSTALMLAAVSRRSSPACVELLAAHSDANAVDARGETALMRVARATAEFSRMSADYWDASCLEALLPYCEVEQRTPNGRTALMIAAHQGSESIVQALLPRANPRVVDREGKNALMLAASHGHPECVAALAPHSDINARDRRGRTAMMFAARSAKPDCVDPLLEGSRLDLVDRDGNSALRYALDEGATECVDRLAARAPLAQAHSAIDQMGHDALPMTARRVDAAMSLDDEALFGEQRLFAAETSNAPTPARAPVAPASTASEGSLSLSASAKRSPLASSALSGERLRRSAQSAAAQAAVGRPARPNAGRADAARAVPDRSEIRTAETQTASRAERGSERRPEARSTRPTRVEQALGTLGQTARAVRAALTAARDAIFGSKPKDHRPTGRYPAGTPLRPAGSAGASGAPGVGRSAGERTASTAAATRGSVTSGRERGTERAEKGSTSASRDPSPDPRAVDQYGRTPLMQAIEAGDLARVKRLIPVSDLNARDPQGQTPLIIAAARGRDACVRELAPVSNPLARDRRRGWTALMFAAEKGHAGSVEALVSHTDTRAVRAIERDGYDYPYGRRRDALAIAAMAGRASCVRALLPASNPRHTDCMGRTPLIAAAMSGQADCVRELLPASDPTTIDGDGQTALIGALDRGHRVAAEILLPASLSCADVRDYDEYSALDRAVERGFMDIAETLLSVTHYPPGRRSNTETMFAMACRSPDLMDRVLTERLSVANVAIDDESADLRASVARAASEAAVRGQAHALAVFAPHLDTAAATHAIGRAIGATYEPLDKRIACVNLLLNGLAPEQREQVATATPIEKGQTLMQLAIKAGSAEVADLIGPLATVDDRRDAVNAFPEGRLPHTLAVHEQEVLASALRSPMCATNAQARRDLGAPARAEPRTTPRAAQATQATTNGSRPACGPARASVDDNVAHSPVIEPSGAEQEHDSEPKMGAQRRNRGMRL
ncbi:ankyrin repeat domain-containing protein [Burkholderia vietnamiensis]|uniref:Ankyrin n=1 Tax=Burkholderia vietnamiensis (strain G4 / LMG 22486) TaxID=269482 RepID=A4JFS8_BURVG|nr:hypothetical protein Bcep1808_2129 [Burkholderia vietnamiensis G4]MCB4344887.1 ankyrin repeat domain-containing protein [Burkholderia vietnamiensis]